MSEDSLEEWSGQSRKDPCFKFSEPEGSYALTISLSIEIQTCEGTVQLAKPCTETVPIHESPLPL